MEALLGLSYLLASTGFRSLSATCAHFYTNVILSAAKNPGRFVEFGVAV